MDENVDPCINCTRPWCYGCIHTIPEVEDEDEDDC